MIQDLNISGLRGFANYSVKGLGRVNLLVGMNNCGKTTILEALQILSSRGDILALYRILTGRGEESFDVAERKRLTRSADIRRLFHNHEIQVGSKFQIAANANQGNREFVAEIVEPPDVATIRQQYSDFEIGSVDADELIQPSGLRMTWDKNTPQDFLIALTPRGGMNLEGYRRIVVNAEVALNSTRLISTSSLPTDAIIELWDAIALTDAEELVHTALRIIEPAIERIAPGGGDRLRGNSNSTRGGMVVRCKGIKNRIPIGSLGDGIWRMLGLALSLVKSANGVLLVDEIDTGLHYSVMTKMWKLIARTAVANNIQIFATTHSRDCFESLSELCRDGSQNYDGITIQRIDPSRSVAVRYSEKEILAAAERGMEVR